MRIQIHVLAYNLDNFLRKLAMSVPITDWTWTTLKDKLIKIGANVVANDGYFAFQMAEVAFYRALFVDILQIIVEPMPS